MAAMAVLALGLMSAQASAASVAVNLSSAGVNLVVVDDCKHEQVKHHKVVKKVVHKNDKKKMDHRHAMARHKVDARRFEDRGRKNGKAKR